MRSPFFTSFSLLLLLVLGSSVRADDTLTVDLPPSQDALNARAAKAQAEAAAKAQAEAEAAQSRAGSSIRSQPSSSSRGSLVSRGQNSSERVMGQLAMVDQQAAIYRSRSNRTQRLTSVAPGTYLAIQQTSGDWCGVLMSDGSEGWVHRQNVHLLDYQVVGSGNALPDFGSGGIAPRTGSEFFRSDPQSLLREAYKYLGVPYRWGGNTSDGIDCSGFVKNVYAANGYPLPRTAAEQMGVGMPVSMDQLQAGDRIYFGSNGHASHTGIYIGNGYFIHASSGNHSVVISRLSESLYQRIYLSARR
ncbi:MAG TPA: C40 family peptidase [Chthonomonadaceae bacterium]|nr:C40 family peptidase [Chthonomonadaceae bacterium]